MKLRTVTVGAIASDARMQSRGRRACRWGCGCARCCGSRAVGSVCLFVLFENFLWKRLKWGGAGGCARGHNAQFLT